jgi:nucleoside 2-deoxyribosyltransferase
MRRVSQIHLAGPDAWYPNAAEHQAARKAMVEAAGFTLIDPGAVAGEEPSEIAARELYAERMSRLRQADAVVINLTPWRGVGPEAGGAFEAGFLAGLGKPVFAYMNLVDESHAEYAGRVEAWMGLEPDIDGTLRDPDGCTVEDLGLPETVMLWAEARRLFLVVSNPLDDLTGLKLCLDALQLYAED